MKRISTDIEYLKTGKITIDADGIPVELENWYRGSSATMAITSPDTLPQGIVHILNGGLAGEIGLPVPNPGVIETYTLGGTTYQKFLTQENLKPTEYVRWRGASGWVGWELTVKPADLWSLGDNATLGLTSLDNVGDGVIKILSTAAATSLGLPSPGAGIVESFRMGDTRFQRWTAPNGLSSNIYKRWAGSGGWGPWELVDAPADLWGRGNSTTLDSADEAGAGWRFLLSASEATRLDLPVSSPAVFETFEVGTWRYQRLMGIADGGVTMWARHRASDWSPWKQIGATPDIPEPDIPAPVVQIPRPVSPAGMKTVPLALTLGQGNAGGGPTVASQYRIPFRYNAPITRWRLCISTRNPRFDQATGSDITIRTLGLGKHTGDGAYTSALAVAPTPIIVQGDGTIWRSQWHNHTLEAGVEYALAYRVLTAGTPPPMLVAHAYKMPADLSTASTTGSLVQSAPLDMWLEAETYATTPVIASWGDSLTCGVGAARPIMDSWLSIYCRDFGALPVHYACSGDTASHWVVNSDSYKWTRWDHLDPVDAMVIAIGSNDLSNGGPLSDIQEDVVAGVELWRTRQTNNLYGANIMPRTNWDAGMESRRVQHNEWLPGADAFRDVFDFATVVNDGAGNLRPEFDADGVHLTAPGYVAVAGAVRQVTAPPVAYISAV